MIPLRISICIPFGSSSRNLSWTSSMIFHRSFSIFSTSFPDVFSRDFLRYFSRVLFRPSLRDIFIDFSNVFYKDCSWDLFTDSSWDSFIDFSWDFSRDYSGVVFLTIPSQDSIWNSCGDFSWILPGIPLKISPTIPWLIIPGFSLGISSQDFFFLDSSSVVSIISSGNRSEVPCRARSEIFSRIPFWIPPVIL